MRFDQTDLRVFIHACEQGTLTAAAARAHLTLAAVSARMRRLEERAGGALLLRHARGVTPTPAGRRLLARARAALAELHDFRADDAPAAPSLTPEEGLVVLANTSALARLPAAPVADLLAGQGHLRVAVRESASHRSVQALQQRTAHLALLSGAVKVRGLATSRIGADPLVAVLPCSHPLARRLSVRMDELLDSPWVGLAPGRAIAEHLHWQASRRAVVLPLRAQVPEVSQVVQLVERGAGVTVLPRMALRRAAPSADVRVIELDEPWARRELLLCALPGALRRGTVAGFVRELADALREQHTA